MTAPSKLDEARLRELAEAATPGPWELWTASDARPHSIVGPTSWRREGAKVGNIVDVRHYGATDAKYGPEQTTNAAFIAAANPATILALLDALSAERERADRAGWRPISEHDDMANHSVILWNGEYVAAGWLSDDGYSLDTDSDSGMLMDPQPTHFRPMPSPPLATQKAEGAHD